MIPLTLGIAVAVPYATAVLLGFSLGKLKHLGPFLRMIWHSSFWIAVMSQIIAIIALATSFFRPIHFGVEVGLVTVSAITAPGSITNRTTLASRYAQLFGSVLLERIH